MYVFKLVNLFVLTECGQAATRPNNNRNSKKGIMIILDTSKEWALHIHSKYIKFTEFNIKFKNQDPEELA